MKKMRHLHPPILDINLKIYRTIMSNICLPPPLNIYFTIAIMKEIVELSEMEILTHNI